MNKMNLPFEAAEYIRTQCPDFKPEVTIVLGSGLADLADTLSNKTVLNYSDIPGYFEPGAEGHIGELVLGELAGVPVSVFKGKIFSYEAAGADCMTTPMRSMHLLGAKTLLYSASSGSTDLKADVGSLVLVTDHINFLGTNPLLGDNDDRFGLRYPSLENCYDLELRNMMNASAAAVGVDLVEGIYAAVRGPAFETKAEIRFLKAADALAVGMSLVPEAIIARHCGMKVVALANITNMAVGMSPVPITHDETLRGARTVVENLTKLLPEFLANYAKVEK